MYLLVKANGIYDILCALCILQFINIPYLGSIHLNMIKNNENNQNNPIFERYYAYWILTYGYMRLTTSDIHFIKMSYYIEALCTINELAFTNNIVPEKALFVIFLSLFFGIVI